MRSRASRVVHPGGDRRRARPKVGRARVGAERGRTVRGPLEVVERTLEVAAPGPVEGEALEVIVERVDECLLMGCGDETVELAPSSTRERRECRVLEQAVCERVLAVRDRPCLADDVRAQEPGQIRARRRRAPRPQRGASERTCGRGSPQAGRSGVRLAAVRRFARREGSRAHSAAGRRAWSAPRCGARRALRSRAATAGAARGRAGSPLPVRAPHVVPLARAPRARAAKAARWPPAR